jgi:hypothetical protein
MTKDMTEYEQPLKSFHDVYPDKTIGQLTMFDRVIFKGYLSGLYPVKKQFEYLLASQGVLLKAYKGYAESCTAQLKAHLQQMGEQAGCAIEYLPGGKGKKKESKEELAQAACAAAGDKKGLIAIYSCLELKQTFTVRGNRQSQQLEAVAEKRPHLHYYCYYQDEEFGLMYVRIQSWWPFEIQIYLNGHEWLAKQLDKAGIGYDKADNCFLGIDDVPAAQRLCEKFAHRPWERVWNHFARRLNPLLATVAEVVKKGYYWTIEQCEIATDVMFAKQSVLDDCLPDLFEEALLAFSAEDVMRFLGRKLNGNFAGNIETRLNKRQAGWRVKHWVKQNALKMYNKQSVLRVETTINKADEFQIEAAPSASSRWKRLPKGVDNAWHFYQVGLQANQRYLQALCHLPLQGKTANHALDSLCQSHQVEGHTVAKFNPLTPESCRLFAILLRGENVLSGLRNRYLVQTLFDPTDDRQAANRQRARVSRLLAKLRGHGLIEKIEHSHLYRVTAFGYRVMSAALHYRYVDFPTQFARA